jgi:hypothetical protein
MCLLLTGVGLKASITIKIGFELVFRCALYPLSELLLLLILLQLPAQFRVSAS